MKKFPIIFFLFLFLLQFVSVKCKQEEKDSFHVGFSQCASDAWRETMNKEMVMTAALYPEIELTILNAEENTRRQELQIQELINQDVDLLIISPNESQPITSIATEAYKSGIPTIIIDRKIQSDEYSAFVGADNYQIGKDVAEYIANIKNGEGKILEIRGMDGSSPAQERHQGFVEGLANYPNLEIVESVDGKWLPEVAKKVARPALKKHEFDIVFGHNDVMARSARKVAEEMNINDLFIIGIDALPNLGMELVEKGVLQASFIYPTGGKKAIEVARSILTGQSYKKHNILGTSVVDSSNVTVLRLQLDQVMAYQEILNKQTERIRKQKQQFNDQRSLLHIALISLLSLVLLSLWLTYYYSMIRRRNSELDQKNKAIEQQKEKLALQNNQIKKMNKEVERATQAKLRFFTNISHEIRTPLTLIQSPINEIHEEIKNPSGPISHEFLENNITLVKQNTERLLRLINQLMDFRKMDTNELQLNISKIRLSGFIKNIYNAFAPLARQKEIEFLYDCPISDYFMWIDVDKIDKVVFNVLSNAFKFTPMNGKIVLKVRIDSSNNALIQISDTGPGIPPEEQKQIFRPFYQQKQHRTMGTGIGLSLSKGFIELHKGHIKIGSDGRNGTTFTVVIPQGKEYASTIQNQSTLPKIPEPEMEISSKEKNNFAPWPNLQKKPSILVVEDDQQLKNYLIRLLSKEYKIKEATDGKKALELIEKNHFDLILTDLMMPEIDGIELTKTLRNNLETSHIPIIMLTAKAGTERKIEGIETGADAYIEKPFNPHFLKVRIRKMIESRENLRQQYQKNFWKINAKDNSEIISNIDQDFLNKLNYFLESNYSASEFSVEELSQKIGMSRIHLYRKMKRLTGLTPSEYINKFRLFKGLELLKEKQGNISSIALDVGFTSPAYFTKRFREEFGASPSEFLKMDGN
ncbi:hybrid sensor histidine kinase/response regulator transcription factor [Anaerophaga thermohalophila]|uniref:hybrid sensor histidine kinase/response regulator transcription factor n=1 Tax=Anaerophaga thermohalophila TaxID=177400 RepID=UPI000237D359|nr:substrate-binding domain-containing protein [Anaerophaga thermohalophila]